VQACGCPSDRHPSNMSGYGKCVLLFFLVVSVAAFHWPCRIALRSHLLLSSKGRTDGREPKGHRHTRRERGPRRAIEPLAEIAYALFAPSKKKQELPPEQLDTLLRSLNNEMERMQKLSDKYKKHQFVSTKVAAQLLYLLQMFKSDDAIGTEFVKLFTAILPISEEFGAQAVGMSLYGLR
jgi:hypothetical protein